jgi:hypothetical protein
VNANESNDQGNGCGQDFHGLGVNAIAGAIFHPYLDSGAPFCTYQGMDATTLGSQSSASWNCSAIRMFGPAR